MCLVNAVSSEDNRKSGLSGRVEEGRVGTRWDQSIQFTWADPGGGGMGAVVVVVEVGSGWNINVAVTFPFLSFTDTSSIF